MRTSFRRPHPRGFTLVEIAVVLFIVGILIAMAAALTRGVTGAQKRSLTATRIAAVDAALLQFVITQRRLPCPADASLPSSNVKFGKEGDRNANGCVDQSRGVVPWRDLGISEVDASDGWDRRLTYRVFPALTVAGGMDMTWCDPAGNAAATGTPPVTACNPATCSASTVAQCTAPVNFLSGKGLAVKDAQLVDLMLPGGSPPTGAAYVVVSHGESGGGAYVVGGTFSPKVDTDGTQEEKNYADANYVVGNYYVDGALVEVEGDEHFDDIVSRPSVMSIVSKAGLGPRTH